MPELMSHAIAVGLSIAVVISLVAMLNVVRTENQMSLANTMADNVCAKVKLAAEQMTTSQLSSHIQMSLPQKIGGEPYLLTTEGHAIIVKSASATSECVVGVSSGLSGGSTGGTIRLTLSGNNIIISGV